MTLLKSRIAVIEKSELDDAEVIAAEFVEQGIDAHVEYDGNYIVALYLTKREILATMEGGVLNSVWNVPPLISVIVADWDDDNDEEPVRVRVEYGFDYKRDVEPVIHLEEVNNA